MDIKTRKTIIRKMNENKKRGRGRGREKEEEQEEGRRAAGNFSSW